jgi:murein DD-endopeptidase MepM/ murein hydrolase activator NlpD
MKFPGFKPADNLDRSFSLGEQFGVSGLKQVRRDYTEMFRDGLKGKRFQGDLTSVGLLRPGLSVPTYLGLRPADGRVPIFNLFDRTKGGRVYSQRVSLRTQQDFRGGRLAYDEHDGVDFVIPPGTTLTAAAPGRCVMIRHQWLRGGLTISIDHGGCVVTQYTHCARSLVDLGQQVRRGEPIAISGSSGVDMTQFFPWVPPHVHFMSWSFGRPIDPFVAKGEKRAAGTWMERNEPKPSAITDEEIPPLSPVDAAALHEAVDACMRPDFRAELAAAAEYGPSFVAALIEEMLHHERHAWPSSFELYRVRPSKSRAQTSVFITMPLTPDDYSGFYFADSRRSRPPLA